MKITLTQLRKIIKEETSADPRLLSARLLSLSSALNNGSVTIEDELSTIEEAVTKLADNSNPKVGELVHEVVVALSDARKALSSLSNLSKKASETSPYR